MVDARILKLADGLVNYSCKVKKGENVLIHTIDGDDALIEALIKAVHKAGGNAFVDNERSAVTRQLLMGASKEQIDVLTSIDEPRMDKMQAFIGIRGANNVSQTTDVPPEIMEYYMSKYYADVHFKIRVPKTKWVVLRYPTPNMAQMADMSTEAFEDFYFEVCNLDYSKMDHAMQGLKDLMDKTDKVRLTGEGTDLSFSIKDIPTIKCAGEMNIPDGEVYTAPVKDSVNGTITYNAPSFNRGFKFENIKLTFKDGKIVDATSNNSELMNKIFDTDEGARFVGEFAIGVNPFITKPMGDTLFDEKIAGSFHFTPGASYDDAFNGNKSAVHWDLVKIQTPEYGGGEIYFDDVMIRKDGMFVLDSLKPLNPENLK
ncbi:MAG: aminopeptidase [Eubacteriales bacterium]